MLITDFLFISPLEQAEGRHDTSSGAGLSDQEREVAASAYEAFMVISVWIISFVKEGLLSRCSLDDSPLNL